MSCIVARWKPCSAKTWRAARTIRSRTACSCSWLTRGIDTPGEWLLAQAYSRDPWLARVDKTNAHSLSWPRCNPGSSIADAVRPAHAERAARHGLLPLGCLRLSLPEADRGDRDRAGG